MSFIQNTRQVSAIIASYFEVLYPQEYAVLKPIFDAGKWVQEDKSGFLGRAFVYKLQVSLHNDGKDFPITVTFPSGSYEGGHYLFPQLEVILRYVFHNHQTFKLTLLPKVCSGRHMLQHCRKLVPQAHQVDSAHDEARRSNDSRALFIYPILPTGNRQATSGSGARLGNKGALWAQRQ